MKKLLIICWVLYFSATCKQVSSTKPELTFIKANSQSWSGGAAGSGHGINYNFYYLVKGPQITFDSAWVDGYVLPVTTQIKGDTIQLTARAYFRAPIMRDDKAGNIAPKEEPQPLLPDNTGNKNTTAVLRYSFNTQQIFIAVPKLDRLKPISYP